MKKKLKVQKAFSGKMMRAATTQGRRVINPGRPGMQQVFGPPRDPNMFATTPPRPGTVIDPGRKPGIYQPGGLPRDPNFFSTTPPRPVMIQPAVVGAPPQPIRNINDMGPINVSPFNSTPGGVRGGMGPLPNNLGPMQGVGDPRLGAATIPGNQAQMQMRDPTQAAPVQPVPAMKRGGSVIARGNKLARSKPTKMF